MHNEGEMLIKPSSIPPSLLRFSNLYHYLYPKIQGEDEVKDEYSRGDFFPAECSRPFLATTCLMGHLLISTRRTPDFRKRKRRRGNVVVKVAQRFEVVVSKVA